LNCRAQHVSLARLKVSIQAGTHKKKLQKIYVHSLAKVYIYIHI
jgi:hypothetical protein